MACHCGGSCSACKAKSASKARTKARCKGGVCRIRRNSSVKKTVGGNTYNRTKNISTIRRKAAVRKTTRKTAVRKTTRKTTGKSYQSAKYKEIKKKWDADLKGLRKARDALPAELQSQLGPQFERTKQNINAKYEAELTLERNRMLKAQGTFVGYTPLGYDSLNRDDRPTGPLPKPPIFFPSVPSVPPVNRSTKGPKVYRETKFANAPYIDRSKRMGPVVNRSTKPQEDLLTFPSIPQPIFGGGPGGPPKGSLFNP